MSDTTHTVPRRPVYCPRCGHYSAPEAAICAYCGEPIMPPERVITRALDRSPLTLPVDRPGQDHFVSDASAILQFLPSGNIIVLALDSPVILGRETGTSGGADLVDLIDFNALQHGVSRQHCQLRRQSNQLVVTDLGSTNGTYLNDRRLDPGRDGVVLHGDKLILGTLHLIITFSAFDS
jgi:hypothetical protein